MPSTACASRINPFSRSTRCAITAIVIAAVVADDEQAAFRALALIDVEYEVLPAVMTIDDALAPGAPLIFERPQIIALRPHGVTGEGIPEPGPNLLYQFNHDVGDIETAFAACDHVSEDTFSFSRMTPYHMEPFVALARMDGDVIEVWTCSQDPFLIRQDIANVFCGVGSPRHGSMPATSAAVLAARASASSSRSSCCSPARPAGRSGCA